MSATIYDIARLTGYNPGTVSRALHNDPRVRAKTREKIREVSNLLGYVPNLAAKSLTTGKTRVIAVVSGTASNKPLSALLESLNKFLVQHDYILMSLFYNNREQFQQCLNRLRSGICDGAILFSPSAEYVDVQELDILLKMNYPLVCFDQWVSGLKIPVVTNNAEESIKLITEELRKHGMDAAYLHAPYENSVAVWRRECAKRLLKKLRIPYTEDVKELPVLMKKKKNLAVYSDTINGLEILGEMFPKSKGYSITGGIFDSWNALVPGCFSGVVLCVQDFDEESRCAVDLLFQMIKGTLFKTEKYLISPKEILVPMKIK